MAIPDEVASDLFKLALKYEIGIGIKTLDPKAFREELYKYRIENPNFEFQKISILLPGTDEVWLVKKEVEL